jgi:hypothetical protein
MALHLVEKIDRIYLMTAKTTLLVVAIATFFPIVVRSTVRRFGKFRNRSIGPQK